MYSRRLFSWMPKYSYLGSIDTQALLQEAIQPQQSTTLQTPKTSPVHRESTHIRIRSYRRTNLTKNWYHANILSTEPTEFYPLFPETVAWMEEFAKKQQGTLGRAFIAVLRPHGKVHRHFDAGLYCATRDRYHLPLQTKGTEVWVEGEIQIFKEGELWWFNNHLCHEFLHNSNSERVHLIFDLEPNSLVRRCKNIFLWAYCTGIYLLYGGSGTGNPPPNNR